MSARTRVVTVVGAAAVLAVGGIVGVTLLQSRGTKHAAPTGAVTAPRPGAPPLSLDLGVRDDPEARAIRRAVVLYDKGRRAAADRIFARYSSLPARIGAAFAGWPGRGLDTMKQLVARNPHSGLAELHL